jgi:Phosphotransferase enzyme family
MTVEDALDRLGVVMARAPFEYATSWPIEEVLLTRRDGLQMAVLVKRFDGTPSCTKPGALLDPDREAYVYRLLAGARVSTARCYAAGAGWILLEKVAGVPLWQSGNIEDWCRAARWAAELHVRFAAASPRRRHLLCHDRRYYETIAARAGAATTASGLGDAVRVAIDRLVALPCTLIHGELYPSNVIVAGHTISPVDWETAALGPGVIDVAALMTGWDSARARQIADAYGGVEPVDVAAARLLLALQWLGWSRDWEPPPEHRRDWVAEAHAAARELVDP